jgi:hypothetical protein
MKRLFRLLSILAFALSAGVWVVLLAWPPEAIAGLGETAASALYFIAILGIVTGALVWAFGDRCIQFIGAVCAVVAFIGLAAFHSTHTSSHREPTVVTTPADM